MAQDATVDPMAPPGDSTALDPSATDDAQALPRAVAIPESVEESLVRRPKRKVPVEDPFAPTGIPLGGLRLYPTLEIGGALSSNRGRDHSDKKAGVGIRVKPGLRLQSDWSRHEFRANASAEFLEFLGHSDLSTKAGSADAALRLDVRHTTHADFDVRYALTSTGVGSSEVPNSATGNRQDQSFGGTAALTHDFGMFEARLRGGVSRNVYGDVKLTGGGEEDNEDRAYTELSLALRGTLNTGAVIRPFAEVGLQPRFHDKKQDRNGIRRDSNGLRLAAGVAIDDELWSGEIAAILLSRNFDDARFDTAWVSGLEGALTWRPTELTRVNFTASAGLSESAALTVAATRNWGGGVEVVQALRENLNGIASLNYSYEKNRVEKNKTITARAGLEWNLNPFLAWNAFYEGTWFNSSSADSDYVDHRLIASIILRR